MALGLVTAVVTPCAAASVTTVLGSNAIRISGSIQNQGGKDGKGPRGVRVRFDANPTAILGFLLGPGETLPLGAANGLGGRFNFLFDPADVSTGADTIEETDHGMTTGEPVRFIEAAGGTLPGATPEIVEGTDYFVRAISSSVLAFFPTRADALANTNRINITDTGSGTNHEITNSVCYAGDIRIFNPSQDPIDVYSIEAEVV